MKLIVTDIDNTVFCWVSYYVKAFTLLLQKTSDTIGTPLEILSKECQDIFLKNGSIEYPFLIQELPSVIKYYGSDFDKMMSEAVAPGRDIFLQTGEKLLKPYEQVIETFSILRKKFPNTPIAALTDAPRYVAMWKLNKLGILNFFDAVYGLQDPRLPVDLANRKVKVDDEILIKHLRPSNFNYAGKIRTLPEEYEKPGVKGLKMILVDYELDEDLKHRKEVLWIGDNLRKDVGLGNRLGLTTAWAKYGTNIEKNLLDQLKTFSPPENIHKNVYLKEDSAESPVPDFVLNQFSDILRILK